MVLRLKDCSGGYQRFWHGQGSDLYQSGYKKDLLEKNALYCNLKGQCHEIFDPRFFSSKHPSWAP
jgi:hypothetical protein